MKKFVETVVGGTIGVIALYIAAKIAYNAGQEMTNVKNRYEQLQKKVSILEDKRTVVDCGQEEEANEELTVEEVSLPGKIGLGIGFHRLLGKKASVIGRFMKNPEGHMIEASVEGDEIHLNVKQKPA